MVRPTKWRRVEFIPDKQVFCPMLTGSGKLEENVLRIEELEAIRLKDLLGLDQAECAARMEISRPTFQRILSSARFKIADSLTNARAIRIEGGNYTRNICPVRCLDCGRQWDESYENFELIMQGKYRCPDCGSIRIECDLSEKKKFCQGHCHRHGCKGV